MSISSGPSPPDPSLCQREKLRVLHLIGSFETGGSEAQAVQLVRMLHRSAQCRVLVACMNREGPLIEHLALDGLGAGPEYRLTSFYNRNAISQLRRFVSYLRDQRVAIVQTHDFYTNIFGMTGALWAGVPIRIAARRESSSFRPAFKRFVERAAYRAATVVVANCEEVKRQLVGEGVRAEKIVSIYNGVNLERFSCVDEFNRDEVLRSLGLRDGSRRFVTMVANLRHTAKDHPTFIRAAAQVHEQLPEVTFLIAGEGPLLVAMRELAAALGLGAHMIFLGRSDRIADLLAISDVAVLSSLSEGLPNAALEYMAAARPVVSTDVGALREILVDGYTGFLVRPGDHAGMARHIAALLRDPLSALEMGRRGRQIVREKFSAESQWRSVMALYEKLIEANRVSFA